MYVHTYKLTELHRLVALLPQEDQPTGLGDFVQLPELKSRVSQQGQEAYIDHCDLISQALMERILQFTEDTMDTINSTDGQPSGKAQPEGGVEAMEEDNGGDGLLTVNGGGLYDGGSGPPSLGSLSLSSQPASLGQQPHSLSVSTGTWIIRVGGR